MKNALVIGGTKGIGFATAKMLLVEGYHVTATYSKDERSAQAAIQSLSDISSNFRIIRADQENKQERDDLVRVLKDGGHLDCIVFNAAITSRCKLQDITDEDWERVMNVNLNSSVYLLRDLLPCIPDGSRLIFMGAMMGVYPHAISLSYGVSKAAVHALAKNLVKFFEGTDTTVNVVAPGFVETDWQKNKPEEIRQNIYNKTALHRFATAEEVADAVKFCINNSFVNGSFIEVSGGYCFK